MERVDRVSAPRDPYYIAYFAELPVVFVEVRGLTVSSAMAELSSRNVPVPRKTDRDWELRGLMAAFRGWGYLLVDSRDPEDERRWAMAHELGHFLLEYHDPWEQVHRRLGSEAAKALDHPQGLRRLEARRRLAAILDGLPMRLDFSLMRRDPQGGYSCQFTAEAEHCADVLAWELLAPARELKERVSEFLDGPTARLKRELMTVAVNTYKVPLWAARPHVERLVRRWTGGTTLREWLRPEQEAP